jgi:hypothetical protein
MWKGPTSRNVRCEHLQLDFSFLLARDRKHFGQIEVCEVAFSVVAFFTYEVAILSQVTVGGIARDAVFSEYPCVGG